jgi:hypothetical protein
MLNWLFGRNIVEIEVFAPELQKVVVFFTRGADNSKANDLYQDLINEYDVTSTPFSEADDRIAQLTISNLSMDIEDILEDVKVRLGHRAFKIDKVIWS